MNLDSGNSLKPILHIIAVLTLFVGALFLAPASIEKRCQRIPLEDRKKLEWFFSSLITREQFGYAIFFDKPMSLSGYFESPPFGNWVYDRSRFTIKECWKIWKKYEYLFPMKKFLLICSQSKHENIHHIMVINRKAFIKFVNEYPDCFDFNGEQGLELLANGEKTLWELVHHDEALVGMLLGYGKKSALAYKRFDELTEALNPMQLRKRESFSLYWPAPSLGYTTIGEEYREISARRSFSGQYRKLDKIVPVTFAMEKEDREAEALIEKYKEQKKNLTSLFSNGNFLEITLKQLCD